MTLIGLVLVALLVFLNGFFVAAEFALVKVRSSELEPAIREGRSSARTAAHMLENLDAYLSACQVGITLASLALGWVGEPFVARLIEPMFHAAGLSDKAVHLVSFPIAFFAITFLHLTVGEQAPKIGAIQRSLPTTLRIALPLSIFYTILKPLVWLVNVSSNLMLRGVGLQPVSEHDQEVTEDEVRLLLTQSAAMGHLTRREINMMENALNLEFKTARQYMVPRNEVAWLDVNAPVEENLESASTAGHTRLPVCDGDLDNVVGVIHIKDVFRALTGKQEIRELMPLVRPAWYQPEQVALHVLLRAFQKNKAHMAILVEEHGVTSGIITLENVLEQVVGQIQDEFDHEEPTIVDAGENRFEIAAGCPVNEVSRRCGLEVDEAEADTIGGVVIARLKHIPVAGESVEVGEHRITVLEAGPARIERVLLEQIDPPKSE